MGLRPLILLSVASMLLTSCATSTLWDATNPHEYLVMKRTPEAEARLQAKGLDYRVDAERECLFVEKSKFRKTHDYLTRFFATPIAVAHDVALGAAVVGAVAYVSSQAGTNGVDLKGTTEQNKELERLERLMKDFGEPEKSGAK